MANIEKGVSIKVYGLSRATFNRFKLVAQFEETSVSDKVKRFILEEAAKYSSPDWREKMKGFIIEENRGTETNRVQE